MGNCNKTGVREVDSEDGRSRDLVEDHFQWRAFVLGMMNKFFLSHAA
jgi:hypothetical protein